MNSYDLILDISSNNNLLSVLFELEWKQCKCIKYI